MMCTAGDTKLKVWDTRTVDSVMTIRKVKKAHSIGHFISALQFDQNKVNGPLGWLVCCALCVLTERSEFWLDCERQYERRSGHP